MAPGGNNHSTIGGLGYTRLATQNIPINQSNHRERYQIIYIRSIIEGLIPNFDYDNRKDGIQCYRNQRMGRKCHLKPVNIKHKNIWQDCLSEERPRLFNLLQKTLCNTSNYTKEAFKKQLDHFLSSLAEKPLLLKYFYLRRADSNSSVKEVLQK